MKSLILGLIFSAIAGGASAATVELRLVIDCMPGQTKLFQPDGEAFCVSPDVIMTDADFVSVAEASGGQRGVLLWAEFDGAARARFSDITKSHVLGRLAVILEGKLLYSPVILSPILGRKIALELPQDVRSALLTRIPARTQLP